MEHGTLWVLALMFILLLQAMGSDLPRNLLMFYDLIKVYLTSCGLKKHFPVLPVQHFTELLDDLSQEALLGQLLSDPFLSGRGDAMDTEEELTPASPVPPHIQAEHSYSLCGDSRPQSPLSHLPGEPGSDAGKLWPECKTSGLLEDIYMILKFKNALFFSYYTFNAAPLFTLKCL